MNQGCAPNSFYSLPGNAGVPGCGVGTMCGSECHYQILARASRAVAAAGPFELEISALRAGAFKPRFVYMFGVSDADTTLNARFEINTVEVQGLPQLIQTGGQSTGMDYVTLIDSFLRPDHPLAVSWMVFGSDSGQTMNISGTNIDAAAATIYVTLWGDAAETSMIGSY